MSTDTESIGHNPSSLGDDLHDKRVYPSREVMDWCYRYHVCEGGRDFAAKLAPRSGMIEFWEQCPRPAWMGFGWEKSRHLHGVNGPGVREKLLEWGIDPDNGNTVDEAVCDEIRRIFGNPFATDDIAKVDDVDAIFAPIVNEALTAKVVQQIRIIRNLSMVIKVLIVGLPCLGLALWLDYRRAKDVRVEAAS